MEVGGALGGIFAGKFKQWLHDFLLINYLPRIMSVCVCVCISIHLYIYISISIIINTQIIDIDIHTYTHTYIYTLVFSCSNFRYHGRSLFKKKNDSLLNVNENLQRKKITLYQRYYLIHVSPQKILSEKNNLKKPTSCPGQDSITVKCWR